MERSKIKEISNTVNMYVMIVSSLALIISAIATNDNEEMGLHIIMGVIFTIACLRHIIARRKAFMKAIKGK
jgi:hypothetical protein